MIGVYKPSTPKTSGLNIIPSLTLKTPSSAGSKPFASLGVCKDSPHNFMSNSSSNAITYNSTESTSNIFDEDTVPYSPSSHFALLSNLSSEEVLNMNYVEKALDLSPLTPNRNIENRPKINKASTVARQLDFNNSVDTPNVKKGKKRGRQKKDDSAGKQDENGNCTGSAKNDNIPKKRRKRKTSSDQNLSHTTNKAVILTPPLTSSKKQKDNVGQSFPVQKHSSPIIAQSPRYKATSNKSKKEESISGVINKLIANKELSVHPVDDVEKTKAALSTTGNIFKTTVASNPGTSDRTLSSNVEGKVKSASTSKVNHVTPEKPKIEPKTKNSSPKRRGLGSPRSPVKNREIKNLHGKDGRELHSKQMDELVQLFRVTAMNRHLRTLLNNREYDILRKFMKMEDDKKYIVMKLFVWKNLWYNITHFSAKAKIDVANEKDILDIFEYLCEEEFVDKDYTKSASLEDLLNGLDRLTVKEVMIERKLKVLRNKEQNIKKIINAASNQTTLTSKTFKDLIMDTIEKKMGFAIKIKDEVLNAFYNAYFLATFTNPAFNKIEDYFHDVIHIRVTFPETPIEDYPVFYSTNNFLSYVLALKMRTELEETLLSKNRDTKFMGIFRIGEEVYEKLKSDTDKTHDHLEAPHLKRFTARHVYTGILSSCCEKMYTKQNGLPSEAKKWLEYLKSSFPNSKRLGKWYEILIRLHMRHLDNICFESGVKVLIEAFETQKIGEIAKHDLGDLGRQLRSSRKYKIDQLYHDTITRLVPRPIDTDNFPQIQIDSRCIRSEELGKKRKYIVKSDKGITARNVEQVALKHYEESGYPEGQHCEGSPVRALLMLYFWDIIYNPTKTTPGTFISKLQTAPLDMFTPHFYPNRKELIDKRLKEIDTEWCEEELITFPADNWQRHSHERAAFGMIMDVIPDQPSVELLVTVIGRRVLAKIFERLIKNVREFSSGMPDLLVWNRDENQSKFVEVKGEGDRLSTGQKLWLQYLKESGAAVEVCHVHSTGSKRKIIKKVRVQTEPEQNNKAGPSTRPDN